MSLKVETFTPSLNHPQTIEEQLTSFVNSNNVPKYDIVTIILKDSDLMLFYYAD